MKESTLLRWATLLATIVTAMVVNGPAIAQSRTANEEYARAAKESVIAFRLNGMSGLVVKTQDCYKNQGNNFFCVYVDLASRHIDQIFTNQMNFPAMEFFTDGPFGSRIGPVFTGRDMQEANASLFTMTNAVTELVDANLLVPVDELIASMDEPPARTDIRAAIDAPQTTREKALDTTSADSASVPGKKKPNSPPEFWRWTIGGAIIFLGLSFLWREHTSRRSKQGAASNQQSYPVESVINGTDANEYKPGQPTRSTAQLLSRLDGLNPRQVKEAFFLNYLAHLMHSSINGTPCPPGNSFEDLHHFSDNMGDIAFWGRCLFYADDDEIARRLGQSAVDLLVEESGRVSSHTIQDMFAMLESRTSLDMHALLQKMFLMKDRFSLDHFSSISNIMRHLAEWPTLSLTARQRAASDAVTSLIKIDPKSMFVSQYTPPNSSTSIQMFAGEPVQQHLAVDTQEAMVRSFLVAGLGLLLGWIFWRVFGIAWISTLIGATGALLAVVLWCYAEQRAGRLIVFVTGAEANSILFAPVFLALGSFLMVLFTAQITLIGGIALTVMFFILRHSFSVSAKANETISTFLLSVLAKFSLACLSIFAFFVLLAIYAANSSKRDDETNAEYQKRKERAEVADALATAATTVGIGIVGIAFTTPMTFEDKPSGTSRIVIIKQVMANCAAALVVGAIAIGTLFPIR